MTYSSVSGIGHRVKLGTPLRDSDWLPDRRVAESIGIATEGLPTTPMDGGFRDAMTPWGIECRVLGSTR